MGLELRPPSNFQSTVLLHHRRRYQAVVFSDLNIVIRNCAKKYSDPSGEKDLVDYFFDTAQMHQNAQLALCKEYVFHLSSTEIKRVICKCLGLQLVRTDR